ncbi:Nop5-like nucleolar protein [Encephalitozoon intestinalis ATCC 50506]|uniref:Nop5-like nucleolar protein n=1 Tax=Encephalitozoon intestinalis (strain ATCC 50506) TaxID=876142 RepID=E0S6N2_ENCIT|nr:Nop5-like nucleolar protein [Encephalitozoon intestinalis ATCC 50506]ADM11367.1 Nop5-like nucleolar protein [Encephalitozoon intestinalis ATCC 50506]UTX45057.1 Nop56p-like nucleolar protein [Encephalitozoon intestinalis]
MIYLVETVVGYGLFDKTDLSEEPRLVETYKFESIDEALESSGLLIKGEVPSNLERFMKLAEVKDKEVLAVDDQKLVEPLSKKFLRKVVYLNDDVQRLIRSNVHKYFGMSGREYSERILCIAHKISMEKVKIVPEKIDTMVIQSVSLLEDMDRDINLHCMRLKEWYGFHFPELSSVTDNNRKYLRLVVAIGRKESIEEKKEELKEIAKDEWERIVSLAKTSMGIAMDSSDVLNILEDAKSVLKSFEFRDELVEYIRVKMEDLAPNITSLIGEVIGAKMISKAGSLSNLAKMPGSSIQIMGAEKALFQALKSKTNTPKYGMIYGCSLLGQVDSQHKGKIARSLASKIAIAARIDSYGEKVTNEAGIRMQEAIKRRIKDLEARSRSEKKPVKKLKYEVKPDFYDDSKDSKKIKLK